MKQNSTFTKRHSEPPGPNRGEADLNNKKGEERGGEFSKKVREAEGRSVRKG